MGQRRSQKIQSKYVLRQMKRKTQHIKGYEDTNEDTFHILWNAAKAALRGIHSHKCLQEKT